jgi:hypothetical protein
MIGAVETAEAVPARRRARAKPGGAQVDATPDVGPGEQGP